MQHKKEQTATTIITTKSSGNDNTMRKAWLQEIKVKVKEGVEIRRGKTWVVDRHCQLALIHDRCCVEAPSIGR
jgi:hypothetical protein